MSNIPYLSSSPPPFDEGDCKSHEDDDSVNEDNFGDFSSAVVADLNDDEAMHFEHAAPQSVPEANNEEDFNQFSCSEMKDAASDGDFGVGGAQQTAHESCQKSVGSGDCGSQQFKSDHINNDCSDKLLHSFAADESKETDTDAACDANELSESSTSNIKSDTSVVNEEGTAATNREELTEEPRCHSDSVTTLSSLPESVCLIGNLDNVHRVTDDDDSCTTQDAMSVANDENVASKQKEQCDSNVDNLNEKMDVLADDAERDTDSVCRQDDQIVSDAAQQPTDPAIIKTDAESVHCDAAQCDINPSTVSDDEFGDFEAVTVTTASDENSSIAMDSKHKGTESSFRESAVADSTYQWAAFDSALPSSTTADTDNDNWASFHNFEHSTTSQLRESGNDIDNIDDDDDDDDDFSSFSSSVATSRVEADSISRTSQSSRAADVRSFIESGFSLPSRSETDIAHVTLSNALQCKCEVSVNVETPPTPGSLRRSLSKTPETKSVLVDRNVWNNLKELENTAALKYIWNSSALSQGLLRAVNIDVRNIFFGHKKHMPIFARDLGLLEPKRADEDDVAADDRVEGQPTGNDQELPAVNFDWQSSGLTNPLDDVLGSHLELDFFVADGYGDVVTSPGISSGVGGCGMNGVASR